MHLQDGILSAPVLVGGAGLAAVGIALGLRQLDEGAIPRTAVLAAAFFALSLVAIPLGPTSVHLLLGGLMGLVLGVRTFPAVLVAIVLQEVLFGFGGLTTLGVNTVVLAGPPVLIAGALGPWLRRAPLATATLAAGAGAGLSVALSAAMMALALASSDGAFRLAAGVVVAAHLPLALVEAFLTTMIFGFLARTRPDIVGRPVRRAA